MARWLLTRIGRVRMKSYLGKAPREVNAQDMPRIEALYREALDILDAPERYPLFVADDERVNAATLGAGEPTLMITSGAVSALTDEELLVVLGHELGHLLCDHVLYQYLSRMLLSVGMRAKTPLVLPGGAAVMIALQSWRRIAELSADRASLLVVQDSEAVQRLFGRLGEVEMTPEEMRTKAEAEREGMPWQERLKKGWQFVADAHPERHNRVLAVDQWGRSDEYLSILSGDYPRRADDSPTGSDRIESAVNAVGRWTLDRREAAFAAFKWQD